MGIQTNVWIESLFLKNYLVPKQYMNHQVNNTGSGKPLVYDYLKQY
jgi:hypothetical protein